MKHLRTLAILIAMLWGYTMAHAEKVEIDGIWYNLVSKVKQAEVTSSDGTGYSGSITIPATVTHNGVEYSVTSIGERAFSYCRSLTSITIPESVTSIEASAFSDCSNLTSITIPESVTSIEASTFSDCSNLTSITIPESVTSIGRYAFSGCSSLTSITIPESVTSIGYYAFNSCSGLAAVHISSVEAWCNIDFADSYANPLLYAENLYLNGDLVTELVIPDGVTSIGYYAFNGCSSLTSITIPNGVTSIGYYAFNGCSSLTSITIPNGVTSIGNYAFYKCSSLTSITIPEGVTSIGKCAFLRCSNLTSVSIPEGVTNIGERAFQYCSSLTAIAIPESMTSIGDGAFGNCSSLAAIVLSKSIQNIGSGVFANCPELTDVYCYAESVPSTNASAFDGSYPEYATLHVPTSALEGYKSTAPWSSFGTIVDLDGAIASITLSESSATLAEGESLTLTIITDPENADRNLISWSSSNSNVAAVDNMGKVTAVAPGTATITVTANDGSGVSASCEVTVKEKLLGKCDAPMVNYTEGKVVLTCSTEEVEYVTLVVPDNELNYQVHEFDFIPTYTFNVYAAKAKYENSDVVSVTICWIDCAEEHAGDDDTYILTIPSQPVLIQSANGVITLTGLADGTAVEIYNLNGMTQGSATAVNGTATITTSLEAGSTAIVKIGKRSVKVILR